MERLGTLQASFLCRWHPTSEDDNSVSSVWSRCEQPAKKKIIYALYKYLTPRKDFDSVTFEPLSYLFSGNIQALQLD